MFSRRAQRRSLTGRFHTAVRTVLPCHSISHGSPTLTESTLAIALNRSISVVGRVHGHTRNVGRTALRLHCPLVSICRRTLSTACMRQPWVLHEVRLPGARAERGARHSG